MSGALVGARLLGRWSSSCTWRVVMGAGIKGIKLDYAVMTDPEAKASSNNGMIPAFEYKGLRICESTAILEFIDGFAGENDVKLIPADPLEAARVRELTHMVNAGVQPIQSLGEVRRQIVALATSSGVSEEEAQRKFVAWGAHFIRRGFRGYEKVLEQSGGPQFSVGSSPSVADLCLLPQASNAANKFGVDIIKEFPRITSVCRNLAALPAVRDNSPYLLPDAPANMQSAPEKCFDFLK